MDLQEMFEELTCGEKIRNDNWDTFDWIRLDAGNNCFVDSHGDTYGLEILMEDSEWYLYDSEVEDRIRYITSEISHYKGEIEALEDELAELSG